MKEISDIIAACDAALQAGRSCALATVVHVEGSSYRRPGARMLVTDDGRLTGAISGGCLEGDALRKALLAISEGKNKLVTYDTTDEDDAKFGVQLGCNGIVHILFEPVDAAVGNHAVAMLKKVMEHRRPAVLGTEFSIDAKEKQPGTKFFLAADDVLDAHDHGDFWQEYARQALTAQASYISEHKGGRFRIFHQFIAPPVSLVIGGAGNDVLPLAAIAGLLGWEVTVVDGRQTHASVQRFPQVKNVVVAKPEAIAQQMKIDSGTVCVLMSHNYNYDLGMLKQLLRTDTPYIGILGPRSKMERMYDDLRKEGITVADRNRIYSPVGLDIGAETGEEIALSIAAEIKAVLMSRNAAMLRNKTEAVHS